MPRLPFALPFLPALHGVPADAGVLASASWVERVAGVPITVPVFATGTSTPSATAPSARSRR